MNDISNKEIEERMQATALLVVAGESAKLSAIDPELIRRIATIFQSTELYARIWLVAACSYLDGIRPIDLEGGDPDKIIDAATSSAAPIKHG
jgi:hypothetical protein